MQDQLGSILLELKLQNGFRLFAWEVVQGFQEPTLLDKKKLFTTPGRKSF